MSTAGLQDDRNHKIKTILAFAAVYIIWGTTYLAIRVAVETIPPFFMAGFRFIIAGAITFVFLRIRGVPWPKRIHWRSAVIIGAFLLLGGNGLVTWSEQQVPSGVAALVVATMPLWMTLFDWLVFRGARPTRRIVTGLLLGLVGIALLIGPGQLQGTATFSTFSLLVLLMAPVLWSFGSLYSREAELPDHIFMSTAIEMLAGGLLLLVAALLTGEMADVQVATFSTRSLVAFIYLTFVGAIIAYTAYIWLLNNETPARVSTYTYINPVIAVFLGSLLLSEPLTALTLVAAVVIIAAVVLITTSKQKPVPKEPRTITLSPPATPEAEPVGD